MLQKHKASKNIVNDRTADIKLRGMMFKYLLC